MGLVARVAEDDAVQSTAAELAQQLADGPTAALGGAKHLVRESWGTTREDDAADEVRTAVQGATADRLIMASWHGDPRAGRCRVFYLPVGRCRGREMTRWRR